MTEGGPPTPQLTLGNHCHKAVIDGLVEEKRNSFANALELRLSSINPSTCFRGVAKLIVAYLE